MYSAIESLDHRYELRFWVEADPARQANLGDIHRLRNLHLQGYSQRHPWDKVF
jgi:hypothetical protein